MMGDLISRQDAILWIKNLMHDIGQPRYSDLWGYEQALDEIQKLLKEESENSTSAQQWIDCSERLPEESKKYLVSCKADKYRRITTTANWQNKNKQWEMSGARSFWKIVAWMPLPEPYKGEEK